MFTLTSNANLYIQAFVAMIVIGMFYNLWISTKLYGGIIGKAVRLFGIGTLFITLAIIEHLLVVFQIIRSDPRLAVAQDAFDLVGLIFLGLGFSALISATKQ